MKYRRFGRTEIQMPVFSCGGMRFQHSWTDQPLSAIPDDEQQRLENTLRRALELGICHVETARGYGSSERQLGVILPTLPRDQLIVQTKVSPLADADEFRRHVLESLERLQLEYVDLLAIHGINTHRHLWWTVREGGCLAVARELVREGKVRHVGFSTHGELDVILDAIEQPAFGGFDYVNLHWYYIFQRNWPAIQAARQRDMGVFIISPADKGGMLYRPSERWIEKCAPLHPLVLNCLFCLQRPEVHTLSLGASCPEDFRLQCSSLEHYDDIHSVVGPITERLDAALCETIKPEHQANLDSLPPWHQTPGYLNIPVMLWLRRLVKALDMQEYAKMRYNLLGRAGHWFAGVNAADVRDVDLSGVIQDAEFREQVIAWLVETHEMLQGEAEKRLSET